MSAGKPSSGSADELYRKLEATQVRCGIGGHIATMILGPAGSFVKAVMPPTT